MACRPWTERRTSAVAAVHRNQPRRRPPAEPVAVRMGAFPLEEIVEKPSDRPYRLLPLSISAVSLKGPTP